MASIVAGPYRETPSADEGNRALVDAYFSLGCAAAAMSRISPLQWAPAEDNQHLIESPCVRVVAAS